MNNSQMEISRVVYSLYYPETRSIVDGLWKSCHHDWYEANYTKKQNEMHVPFLGGWREWAAKANVKLGGQLRFDYPTNGASEGIQHLMAYYASKAPYGFGGYGRSVVHVFEGEYEGYRKIATALGMRVIIHQRHNYELTILEQAYPGDVFFISQPSAIDGNVWSGFSNWINWMNVVQNEVSIVVDLTYVGAVAKEYEIILTSPNIKTVLWSLSKPFGVYYHRIGGLVNSIELPTLYGNFWFKNLFSIHLGTELMKQYGPYDLPKKYTEHQKVAINHIKTSSIVNRNDLVPSDVVLLAHQRFVPSSKVNEEFIRVKNDYEIISRYCLTPRMDATINTV